MKKLLFIINPMAGRQQAQTDLYKMVKIFADHDYEVTVYPTRARLDCTRKVLEDAGRFDLVVCCGGDGTLNEMVSGMMQRQDRRPMGYIPLGSTIFWRASRAWARSCPSMSKSPPMTSSSRRITSSAPSPIPSPWAAS